MTSAAAKPRSYRDKLPVFGDGPSNYSAKRVLPGMQSTPDAAEARAIVGASPLAFAPTFD